MKPHFSALFSALIGVGSLSAQNHVANYSFEEHSACPNDYNQVERCIGWFRSTNNNEPEFHTEYLHACGSFNFGSPQNTWGYQVPVTGEGYMALVTMAPTVMTDYRENIYTQLVTPLIVGKAYSIQINISLTDNSRFASNNFGARLSTTTNFPIDNNCVLAWPEVVTNTSGWTTVSTTFVADSAYTYLAVGNFMTDANTTSITACASCPFVLHGYYVDDVCLVATSEVENYNCAVEVTPTGIASIEHGTLSIRPTLQSATQDQLFVELPGRNTISTVVFDIHGRSVDVPIMKSGNGMVVSTTDLASGPYTVSVMNNDGMRLSGRFVVVR